MTTPEPPADDVRRLDPPPDQAPTADRHAPADVRRITLVAAATHAMSTA